MWCVHAAGEELTVRYDEEFDQTFERDYVVGDGPPKASRPTEGEELGALEQFCSEQGVDMHALAMTYGGLDKFVNASQHSFQMAEKVYAWHTTLNERSNRNHQLQASVMRDAARSHPNLSHKALISASSSVSH